MAVRKFFPTFENALRLLPLGKQRASLLLGSDPDFKGLTFGFDIEPLGPVAGGFPFRAVLPGRGVYLTLPFVVTCFRGQLRLHAANIQLDLVTPMGI